MFQPYPYQQAAIEGVRDACASGHKDVLVVAPTGGGKTLLAVFITIAAIRKRQRVWFVAPLDALIDQTYDSYIAALKGCNINAKTVGVIHPDFKPHYERPVQVVAQKTAQIRIKAGKIPPQYYPNIFINDECHTTAFRQADKDIKEVLDEYSRNNLAYALRLNLGLTGSPCRTSKFESMSQRYSAAVFTPSTNELTAMGKLAPLKFHERCDELDLATVVSSGYDDSQIKTLYTTSEAISKAVDLYEEFGEKGKAIAFCVDVDHAKDTASEFRRRGYVAECIDFTTPRGKHSDVYPEQKTRRSMIKAYAEGKIHILTGKDVLAVGFDEKSAIVALLLRPTNSLSTHIQQLGRVRRALAGKLYGIVLDLVGNCRTHGYGDDEWAETDERGILKIFAPPAERGDPGMNPFAVDCENCNESIHAQQKICPHCGAEQPEKVLDPSEQKSFDGTLIETLRPQTLNANSEEDAQRYYRYLRQRAVLVHRALPGLGYLNFCQSKQFGHWGAKIPREPSLWTIGAIFNNPEDIDLAYQFYIFLNTKISRAELDPARKFSKIWYAMQLEFSPNVVATIREKVAAGALKEVGEEARQLTSKPVKVQKAQVPNW